jgi:hypothetical protein
MPPLASAYRDLVESRVYLHYLRTGLWADAEPLIEAVERKFNPYHDEIGRFTSPPGVTVSYGNTRPSPASPGSRGSGRRRRSALRGRTARVGTSSNNNLQNAETPTRKLDRIIEPPSHNPSRQVGQEDWDHESAKTGRASALVAEADREWRDGNGQADQERFDEWANRPARSSYYTQQAPKVVEHIRSMYWNLKTPEGDRIMKFADVEKYLMDRSTEFWARNVLPPYVREHAIFVYQNEADPTKYEARIVTGDGANGVGQLHDFTTQQPIEGWSMPKLAGHRLIMVEHTHPVGSQSTFGARGHAAPSNRDVCIASQNPGAIFVVNQLVSTDASDDGGRNAFYYSGF